MTKAQREKAERLMLKHMLDTNPKLKKFIDSLIDNPQPEIKDVVQPVITEKLLESRMIGVNIGWEGAMLSVYQKIQNMESVEEIKSLLRKEINAIVEKLQLNPVFDENGNIIITEKEEE